MDLCRKIHHGGIAWNNRGWCIGEILSTSRPAIAYAGWGPGLPDEDFYG